MFPTKTYLRKELVGDEPQMATNQILFLKRSCNSPTNFDDGIKLVGSFCCSSTLVSTVHALRAFLPWKINGGIHKAEFRVRKYRSVYSRIRLSCFCRLLPVISLKVFAIDRKLFLDENEEAEVRNFLLSRSPINHANVS